MRKSELMSIYPDTIMEMDEQISLFIRDTNGYLSTFSGTALEHLIGEFRDHVFPKFCMEYIKFSNDVIGYGDFYLKIKEISQYRDDLQAKIDNYPRFLDGEDMP